MGGSDHAPTFRSKVYVNEQVYGEGMGKNKKEAEQSAAADAIKQIQIQTLMENNEH
jgi:ribonuclease-3